MTLDSSTRARGAVRELWQDAAEECAQHKKYRKAEEEDVDAAIADLRRASSTRDTIMNLDRRTPIHGTCSQSQLRV